MEENLYATYNSLNRNPLVWGVPILILISLGFLIVLSAFIGAILLGDWRALIVPVLLALIVLFIKVACMDDSKAVESLKWNFKGVWTRILCKSRVASYSSIDSDQIKRKEIVYEWFKYTTYSEQNTKIHKAD
jgi:type IV secretion system protein VirB3